MVYVIQVLLGMICIGYIGHCLRPTIKVKNKRELGIKRANLIYADEKGTKLLVAEALGLQGKPDMIFQTWILRQLIPLEIKSGRLKDERPHLGDLYQLVVYFLLVESAYGRRPPYGKLVYANKTFKIRNTRKLRRKVFQTVSNMREMLEGQLELKAEPEYMKCKHCICKGTVCKWNKGE